MVRTARVAWVGFRLQRNASQGLQGLLLSQTLAQLDLQLMRIELRDVTFQEAWDERSNLLSNASH